MAQEFRLPQIVRIARAEGRVSVEDLATRLGVTAQTIRRDLADLDAEGTLARVHGGAVLRSGTQNIAWRQRAALNAPAKEAIARAAAAEIPDGASVFLAIGTTTEALARALLERDDLLVVTNNVNIAVILAEAPRLRVVLTGGTLRHADGGLTGPLAEAALAQFKVDIAVIGCSALDINGDLLDYDMAEVAFSRALIADARRSWLLADAAKLARQAPVRIASLSALDALFTDAPLPAPLSTLCVEWGTRVLVSAE